jgi:hypothetical protein
MFDKRSPVHRTFFTVKHFPNSVDAAMPNKAPETGEWVCGVGVGVRKSKKSKKSKKKRLIWGCKIGDNVWNE